MEYYVNDHFVCAFYLLTSRIKNGNELSFITHVSKMCMVYASVRYDRRTVFNKHNITEIDNLLSVYLSACVIKFNREHPGESQDEGNQWWSYDIVMHSKTAVTVFVTWDDRLGVNRHSLVMGNISYILEVFEDENVEGVTIKTAKELFERSKGRLTEDPSKCFFLLRNTRTEEAWQECSVRRVQNAIEREDRKRLRKQFAYCDRSSSESSEDDDRGTEEKDDEDPSYNSQGFLTWKPRYVENSSESEESEDGQ